MRRRRLSELLTSTTLVERVGPLTWTNLLWMLGQLLKRTTLVERVGPQTWTNLLWMLGD